MSLIDRIIAEEERFNEEEPFPAVNVHLDIDELQKLNQEAHYAFEANAMQKAAGFVFESLKYGDDFNGLKILPPRSKE